MVKAAPVALADGLTPHDVEPPIGIITILTP